MKAVESCTHDFHYDNRAVHEAQTLSKEMSEYYEYLRYTARPDEIQLVITDIDGLTVVDEQTNTIVNATMRQLRAEFTDGELRCSMVFELNNNIFIYRYTPETGWKINGEAGDDEPMTHADMVGELSRWIDISRWPHAAQHYLDKVDIDSMELIYFLEDVLLPQASQFRKELAYKASDYGALPSTVCGDTQVSLRAVTQGRVRSGEQQVDEDYVYLAVEQPTLDNGTPAQLTQAIVKSAYGTTSTESVMDNGKERRILYIDKPEAYFRRIKAGFGVLQAQKTLDTISIGYTFDKQ